SVHIACFRSVTARHRTDTIGGRLRRGQAYPEPRRMVGRIGAHLAARRLDQLLYDREPDARASARRVARLLHPVEALEDNWAVGRGDSVAGVADRDRDGSATRLGPNRRCAA